MSWRRKNDEEGREEKMKFVSQGSGREKRRQALRQGGSGCSTHWTRRGWTELESTGVCNGQCQCAVVAWRSGPVVF